MSHGGKPPPGFFPRPEVELGFEDEALPLANVVKCIADHLPPQAKVSNDAKALMQEIASEVVFFVRDEASSLAGVDRAGHIHITEREVSMALEVIGLSFANTSMHAGQASSSFAPPKPALAPVSTAIHQTLAEVLSAQSQAMGPMASMRPSACMPSGTYAERFFAMLDDDQDDEEEATDPD